MDEYYRCRDLLNNLLKTPKLKSCKADYELSPMRTHSKTLEKLNKLGKLIRNSKENENVMRFVKNIIYF